MSYKHKIEERLKHYSTAKIHRIIEDRTGNELKQLCTGITELYGQSKKAIYHSILGLLEKEIKEREEGQILDADFEIIDKAGMRTVKHRKKLSFREVLTPLLTSLLITSILLFIFEYRQNERLDSKIQSQLTYISVLKDYGNDLKTAYKWQSEQVAIKDQLINEQSAQLTMLYTFHEAGITAQSQDEIKELIDLADLAPYGSPFTGGHIITSKFGVRDERWMNGDGNHIGTDAIPLNPNDNVVNALFDGYITDWGVDHPTYGKWVEYVNKTETFKVKYAHLSKIFWQDVDKRQVEMIPFSKGSRIGVMGDTGLTFGAHLHLEIYVKDRSGEWRLLNPEEMLDFI